MMQYKGYVGKVEIDPEADLLYGEVLGLRDVITFQGHTPAETEKAFHDSVDDYLEFCKERDEQPEKPYSGKFMVRVDPLVHKLISMMAEASKLSLNAWINHAILKELNAALPASTEAISPRARRGGSGGLSSDLSVSHADIAAGTVLPAGFRDPQRGPKRPKSSGKASTKKLYVGHLRGPSTLPVK